MYKSFRSKYTADKTGMKELRSATRRTLKTLYDKIAGTIEDKSPKTTKNLPEQIKLERQNLKNNDGTIRS